MYTNKQYIKGYFMDEQPHQKSRRFFFAIDALEEEALIYRAIENLDLDKSGPQKEILKTITKLSIDMVSRYIDQTSNASI